LTGAGTKTGSIEGPLLAEAGEVLEDGLRPRVGFEQSSASRRSSPGPVISQSA